MSTWSLRTRFLLVALACLIPLAAVVGYYVDRSSNQNTEQILAHESTIASSVSRSTSTVLSTNTDALEGIAQRESVIRLDPEESDDVLGQARRIRPELSGIFLIDSEQSIVGSSGTDPAPLLPEITEQLDQTVTSGEVTISQRVTLEGESEEGASSVFVLMVPVTTVQTTTTSGLSETPPAADTDANAAQAAAIAPTAAPDDEQSVQPPGRTTGVVGGIIQADRFAQSVLPATRGQTEVALVSGGQILFATSGINPDQSAFIADQQEQISLALEGDTHTFTMTDTAGVDRTAIALPVSYEPAPWAVIVTHPIPAALEGMSTLEAIFVSLLAVIVIIAFAVVLGEITARPLRTLSNQAKALHQGKLKGPITPLGGGEIRTLSEQFSEMADQINHQVAGLEENRHDRERQAAQMRDLLRRTNRMQEDERRRIAGEIHDAVSPLITGALYQARALHMTNGSTPREELDSSLASVNDLLERASNELHDVIFELRPPDLDDLGVVAAIEAYVQTIKRTGLDCRLEASGDTPTLTPEVRLGIYRIVQEALHNVVRHAGADEAVVRLEVTDQIVRVTIRDNGAGFDPAQAVQPTSLGLLSMRERAESIGATFTIVSKPGGGTAIVIERPNSGDVMSDEVLESMMSMSGSPDGSDAEMTEHESAPDEQTADLR